MATRPGSGCAMRINRVEAEQHRQVAPARLEALHEHGVGVGHQMQVFLSGKQLLARSVNAADGT